MELMATGRRSPHLTVSLSQLGDDFAKQHISAS
jgi:hypothetical protein